MNISDIAIRRPVFTTMMAVGIVALGWMGYARLGTSLYPDVTFPIVSVVVPYPGASPEDIERDVVKPIEDAVVSLNAIDRVEAIARDNVGIVVVKFDLGVALDAAANDVRERVQAVRRDLPDGIDDPVVQKADIAAAPVLVYAASADASADEVRRTTVDVVKPALEQVAGVARVDVLGGREREVQVELDAVRLEAYGLTPLAIVEKLRAENATVPAGHWSAGGTEVGVRTVGELASVDAVRDAVLFAGPDGTRLRVGDVADVRDGFAEQRVLVRTNGREAVAFQVVKNGGANSVEVADAVKDEIQRLTPTLPAGYATTLLIDQSHFVKENAHEVNLAIVFGGAMAILIILLFMMDLRSTFISALALPTAVIGTFLMMWLFGFTLNMMTLLALSLSIGLLIDDAVVVRENIFRHLEAGRSPAEAASRGTSEIALAVFATTMTIVAVFVPVAFMSGIVGQFFRQFGLTVTGAVLLSMLVAFTLDPMLSARLARAAGTSAAPAGRLAALLQSAFTANEHGYRRALAWALAHPRSVVAAATAVFFGSVALGGALGSDFMAAEDRGQIIVNLEYPAGTSLDETARRSAVLERRLQEAGSFQTVFAVVGPDEEVNKVKLRLDAGSKLERDVSLFDLKKEVRALLGEPGVKVVLENPPVIEGLSGMWRPVMASISGPSYETLLPTAERVAAELRGTDGVSDVSIEHGAGKPEMRVELDRGLAGRVGVPVAVAALNVRAAIAGASAGRIRTEDKRGRDQSIDIRVRLRESDRSSPEALARLPLRNGAGTTLHLGDIARIAPGTGPAVIQRIDRERRILVTAAPEGRPLGAVFQELRPRVEAAVPEGYRLTWLGDVQNMEESNAAFGMALAVAILFIYIVLASQFESFIHPATIMLSLPLSLVGAMVGLALYGGAVTLGAQIGIILLMGLVTKNAILLVDKALVLQREGMSAREAILAAGPLRLRPILMTSAAMALGMLPTALGRGEGSEFRAPMAVAVVGGVISSTLLTLFVVPVVFLAVESLRRRVSGLTGRVADVWVNPTGRRVVAAGLVALALVVAGALSLVPRWARAAEAPDATRLTLEAAWQLAAESSPDFAVLRERVEQADADARAALAAILPQIEARGSYMWLDRETQLTIPGAPIPPITVQESPFYQGQVAGTWPLVNVPGFFARGAAEDGARAAAAGAEAVRQELFLAVAQAWWGVATADRMVEAAEEAGRNAAELARISELQVEHALATELGVLRARVAEQEAAQAFLAARGARTVAEAMLRRLTGVTGRIEVTGMEPRELALAPAVDAAWRTAQRERPELVAAEATVEARLGLYRARLASYLPVVAPYASWSHSSSPGLTGRKDAGMVGVVAGWALLDGGLREAMVSGASAAYREAVEGRRALERKAYADISIAAADYDTSLAKRAAAGEAVALATQAQRLAAAQFRAGTATNLELVQANAALLHVRAGLARADAEAALAELALRRASGEPLFP